MAQGAEITCPKSQGQAGTMSGDSQVHVFWGAPDGPLKMTASQEPTSLISTAEPWKKIQFLYNQRSLQLKDEKCKHKALEDRSILEAADSPVHSDTFLLSSVHVKDDSLHCISETQMIKSQKTCPSKISDVSDSGVQVCRFKGRIQHLAGEEKCQKLSIENRTITVEQHNYQSSICGQKLKENSLQVDCKCAAILDLVCRTKQTTTETKCVHRDIQNQCLQFFPSKAADKPGSKGAVRMLSDFKLSTDTEFLSIMTSSQIAFLAQRRDKGQNSINKGAISMEIESNANQGEESTSEECIILSNDPAEDSESGENQGHSLELFSPVSSETKSGHIDMNFDKGLEGNTGSQELFRSEDKLPPTEICVESFSSGILCSQLRTFPKGSAECRGTSEDKPGHSKASPKVLRGSKETKRIADARDPAIMPGHSNVSELKHFKKTSLIQNCDCKSRKYNCLVMVLAPCHVKEISIKSGPNSGSKVPLAIAVVVDQSDMRKKVFLWRTAAFWALTVFLGDIILLTDVTIHEDQWVGETVLQSTFTSQLLNLGMYSSVQPEEYSSVVSAVVLQDLLAYVSSKHPYLRGLPQRQPQKANAIDFVELEQLQPDILVHVILRVVDITLLTEALYNYRGQRQRKVVLTVEQAQGQHYVLVLWGPGAAWYPQLQRKKDYIWEFKYLLVQRNYMLENLELHTTPWSSCECLFDDDKRAVQFKAKFQRSAASLTKISDLATHLEEKRSGVVLIKPQILELNFPVVTAQKSQITFDACSSLKSIFSSLPNIIYTGCAKCGLELETDENKIYKQCFSCLPFIMKKTYYRPALMTVVDGSQKVCIHVGSELIEKILLNIPPGWLNRVIGNISNAEIILDEI